jgi:hypothetical protein
MPFVVEKQEQWSKIGLRVGLGSVAAVVVLSLVDGVLRQQLGESHRAITDLTTLSDMAMWATWLTDFRYMFEQLIYVGAIVFIGAKFIETRTIFTVGFARQDAERVRLQGPDENNIVWIGQRYNTALEASAAAEAIKSRLEDDQRRATE